MSATPDPKREARKTRLLRWLVFSLSIALVPLLLRYLGLAVFHMDAGIDVVLGDGGLLLIATAVCADTVGETFALKNSERASAFMIISIGASFLTSIVSSALWAAFALVKQVQPQSLPATPDVGSLVLLSVVLFGISVAVGVAARWKMPYRMEEVTAGGA